MNDTLSRWMPMLAFLLVAVAGGYAIQQSSQRDAELLHEGLMQACELGNERGMRFNVSVEVVEEVLMGAAASRRAEAAAEENPDIKRVRLEVAEQYEELAGRLLLVEPVDCESAVPNP